MTVSIHAPTGGATKGEPYQDDQESVSIHAPTGGATRPVWSPLISISCFNPRAHGGRDRYGLPKTVYPKLFQSTRPRGARPATWGSALAPQCFNPRAHGGRDNMSR
mgnify:CR=1 FL=1